MPEETIRAEWNRRHVGAGTLILAAGALALYLSVLGFSLVSYAVGSVAVLLGVGLGLVVVGSRVVLTEARLLLRAGFLPYSFPWSDIRGFVVDRRSPSDLYVVALHPEHRTPAFFEIPPVTAGSPLALAARLNGEAQRHRRSQ